jgi:transcriptional regulator with XRE-family HTH domain
MVKQNIGEKIRALRIHKGISQEELGKSLERSHAAVSDIERGKTDLSVNDLYKIAKFFDISVTYFLEEDQNTSAPTSYNFRDAKNITPEEKKMADKVAMDFIKHARELAKEKNSS